MNGFASPLAEGLALVFDMDGVIVDSNPLHREAWAVFNRRYGLETTEDMHGRMYGKRNDEIVRDFFGTGLSDEEVAARGAAKEEVYRDLARRRFEQMLVPGIREFLEEHRGAPMALATNAEPANVAFVLRSAGLEPYFRVVVDGHQVTNPKPHPEVYLRAADRLGISPANCIVFEDSFSGVAAAQGAGMRVVGLATTHGDLIGTSISVDNFESRDLRRWLASQVRVD
jgi:beta-phosphoglucomutase